MEQVEMVGEIINLYNEIEKLKNQVNIMKAKEGTTTNGIDENSMIVNRKLFNFLVDVCGEEIFDNTDKYAVCETAYNTKHLIFVEKDEVQTKMNFIPFEQWFNTYQVSDLSELGAKLTNDFSFKEIKAIFKPFFQRVYEQRLKEAKSIVLQNAKEAKKN